jgi:hypothetical protein
MAQGLVLASALVLPVVPALPWVLALVKALGSVWQWVLALRWGAWVLRLEEEGSVLVSAEEWAQALTPLEGWKRAAR